MRFAWLVGIFVVGCGGSGVGPGPQGPVANRASPAEVAEGGEVEPEGKVEPGGGEAAKAELERVFAEGKAAYDAGDFALSATLFERVYAQWPKPEILYNIAQARRMNGEIGPALAALRKMQTMQLSTFIRDEVDRVIKEIEAQYPPNQAASP